MGFSYIEIRNIIKYVIVHTKYFVNVKKERVILKIKATKN